jgi:hypothetical protein
MEPDVTIPQPVSSGAVDHPEAAQSGVPQSPAVPEGFGDTQGPPPPAGFTDTPPEQGNTEKPGFFSTLGSDVLNAGKGLRDLSYNTANFLTSTPNKEGLEQGRQIQEEHKHKVYTQIKDDLHNGNYVQAFSHFGDLFDPHYDDPNDPISRVIQAQWDSSKLAKERMMEAAKNKDYASVVQHAAGILPVASQVDSAMETYRKDPTRENLAHVISSAIPAFVPSLMKGAKYVMEGASETLEAAKATGKATTEVPKPNLVRPSTVKIAGEDVPVSTPQLSTQSKLSKAVSSVATEEGAQGFIDREVQPAAINATGNTFRDVAQKAVSDLRDLSGESGSIPRMETIDEMAKAMEAEAKKTYSRLDDAGQSDIEAVVKRNKEGAAAARAAGRDFTPQELPKSFTELQEGINDAKATLKSRTASTVDKELAKSSLKDYNSQMGEFLTKHGDSVNYGELDAANGIYQRAQRFKYIAKNIRSAVKGVEESDSELNSVPSSINKDALASLPAKFDNRFGEGAFEKTLGNEGLKNFNDIIKVLQNPFSKAGNEGLISTTAKAGAKASDFITSVAKLIGKPVSWTADKLLFDPEFGQSMLKRFGQLNRQLKR